MSTGIYRNIRVWEWGFSYISVCTQYISVYTITGVSSRGSGFHTRIYRDIRVWEVRFSYISVYTEYINVYTIMGVSPRGSGFQMAVRDCCLRKRMISESWNRAKRSSSWASDGSQPAPAQILGNWPWRLPFSVTDHGDCHFRDESPEKVIVLTSNRHSRASAWGKSGNLEFLKNLRFPSRRARLVHEAARLTFCNWIGRFLKWHQWQMAATRISIEI